jgi:S-adenosylmethionine synthetase
VAFAPLTPLEQLVLAIEKHINTRNQNKRPLAWSEDVKVMGVRHGKSVRLTIACAMVGQHLADIDDYLAQKTAIQKIASELGQQHGFAMHDVGVNAADDPSAGVVYLTVTGTSAEAGDDGQFGRGNRVNGLITPGRPMSLEAAAEPFPPERPRIGGSDATGDSRAHMLCR